MSASGQLPETTRKSLRLPVGLTWLGLWAEWIACSFWPLWSVLFIGLSALMLGWHDAVSVEILWISIIVFAVLGFATALWGVVHFKRPARADAMERVDQSLDGRPIAALNDTQAVGAQDAASQAVWQAHLDRMATKARAAKPVSPDLALSGRDRFALRYVALLFLAVALLFGSLWRVSSVATMSTGSGQVAAIGPVWEGWIEPPLYTGKPSLYLNDLVGRDLELPVGSQITLRLYGEVGALTVAETVSGRQDGAEIGAASAAQQNFTVQQNGQISIDGDGGAIWDVQIVLDQPPEIELLEGLSAKADGEMSQQFEVFDDYGVSSGQVVISLDLEKIDRVHGLLTKAEPRPELVLDLPMPFGGDPATFTQLFVDNQSLHPFANLPVTMTYSVTDEADLTGFTEPQQVVLPGRRFFDPLAKAVIEQRRDLLWSRENAPRVTQILRAVSHKPDGFFRSETAYLRLRFILRRLENMSAYGVTDDQQNEIAQALWDLAVILEEGTLADAYERLQRAQDQLAEAMRNGASDDEIAELMDELREAMDNYMRQLAQQQPEDGAQQQQQAQNSQEITQDQLDALLDEIERLMQEGQMAEAQALMEQLNQMMENMQVQEGQSGEGQSPGQQAMEGLSDTLREQQGLSDQAFRDLQEQFNPNAQAGENSGNEGRNGGEGRGQSHEGQSGEGEGTEGEGAAEGGGQQQSLADRQQALRDELNRQQQNLPGMGGAEADATREALDRAGDAMDQAENALRSDDLAGAIDNQAEAIEALREGMRNLADAMAENQREQQGQGSQSDQAGTQDGRGNQDPLGRSQGGQGDVNTDENLLQDEDVYRRARELLDEIRKRSSESDRPDVELDYLKRLLDRF